MNPYSLYMYWGGAERVLLPEVQEEEDEEEGTSVLNSFLWKLTLARCVVGSTAERRERCCVI